MTNPAQVKQVTVQVLGDASQFRRTIKDVQKMQGTLGDLSQRYQKSGLSQTKTIQQVNKIFNKQQEAAGKKALEHERRLKKQMDDNLKVIKQKQKTFKGSADAIKDEVKELKKLEREYRKVHAFRKSTGVQSGEERAQGIGRGAARGLGAAAGFVGFAATAAIGALVKAMTAHIGQAYGSYVNFGRSAANLSGTGMGVDDMFDTYSGSTLFGQQRMFRLRGFDRSRRLGYSATETLQQMHGIASATGGGPDLLDRTQTAQSYARMYGGDVGQVGGFMGTLTQAQGAYQKREFERMMTHAMSSGMDKSRTGEAMGAMTQAITAAGAVSGGRVDTSAITGLMAFFGRSGNPALQGGRGANILGGFDAAIKAHGNISVDQEAAKALLFQSFGFGTRNGDSGSYFDVLRRSQQGVFGKGGAANLLDMIGGVEAHTGGGQAASYALSGMTGLSMDQVDAVRGAVSQGGSREEILERIQAITNEARPVDERTLDVLDKSLHLAQRSAEIDNELIEHGRSSADAIEDIQDSMRQLIHALMPTAVAALETIRDAIIWIRDKMKDLYGDSVTAQQQSAANTRDVQFAQAYRSGNVAMGDLDAMLAADKAAFAEAQANMPELSFAERQLPPRLQEVALNARRSSQQSVVAQRRAQLVQSTRARIYAQQEGITPDYAMGLARVEGLRDRMSGLDPGDPQREALQRQITAALDTINMRNQQALPSSEQLAAAINAPQRLGFNPDDPASFRASISATQETTRSRGRVDGGN